jgi:hypothetical protein
MAYTSAHLSGLSLPELKAIASESNIVPTDDKRCKESWVKAILNNHPTPAIQEVKTCAGCDYYAPHGDGSDKGWCRLFDRFARNHHELTQDCINTIQDEKQRVDDYLFHEDPVIEQLVPQKLKITKISEFECEAWDDDVLVADIWFNGKNWVVMQGDRQIYQDTDYGQVVDFIRHHHQRETFLELPSPIGRLPAIGDTFLIGNYLLRCIELCTSEYAVAWDVYDGNYSIGEIMMNYNGFWRNSQGLSTFASPQEAVLDLVEHIQSIELVPHS